MRHCPPRPRERIRAETAVVRIVVTNGETATRATLEHVKGLSVERAEAVRAYAEKSWSFTESLTGRTVWFVVPVTSDEAGSIDISGAYVVAPPICRTPVKYPMTAGALGAGGKFTLKPFVTASGAVSLGEVQEDERFQFVRAVNASLSSWRYNPRYAGLPLRSIRFQFEP